MRGCKSKWRGEVIAMMIVASKMAKASTTATHTTEGGAKEEDAVRCLAAACKSTDEWHWLLTGDGGLTVTATAMEMMTRRRTQQSNTDKGDRRKTNIVREGGTAVASVMAVAAVVTVAVRVRWRWGGDRNNSHRGGGGRQRKGGGGGEGQGQGQGE
jgi:hypothetical protein